MVTSTRRSRCRRQTRRWRRTGSERRAAFGDELDQHDRRAAVVVPAGFYPSGLPFGLEFSARPWTDGDLLAVAYAWEQATHLRKPPVLVEHGLITTTPAARVSGSLLLLSRELRPLPDARRDGWREPVPELPADHEQLAAVMPLVRGEVAEEVLEIRREVLPRRRRDAAAAGDAELNGSIIPLLLRDSAFTSSRCPTRRRSISRGTATPCLAPMLLIHRHRLLWMCAAIVPMVCRGMPGTGSTRQPAGGVRRDRPSPDCSSARRRRSA